VWGGAETGTEVVLTVPACIAYATPHGYRRQLAQEVNVRLDERVNERTRIARDLHDTLLQSFQGLMLRFQAAHNLFPERPAEALKKLQSAIDHAAKAITECRDIVQGLRSSRVESSDLTLALKYLGEELATGQTNGDGAKFFVEVEGSPRDLHPIIQDEVHRIAGEALCNAFRHAQARRIAVTVGYDERQLRLCVRDNGMGIDPAIPAGHGRAGHWGLVGMGERAELIGGRLEVWSQLRSGTEVGLTIPASTAYKTSPVRQPSQLFAKTQFAKTNP
jgi:signal transduction histidine kinase